jgi:hypothetical protein
MALAQIGPLTSLFEATAAAVGAGVVLGSVVMGVARLAAGWSRKRIERRALTDGYLGGIFGAAVAVVDVMLRYSG